MRWLDWYGDSSLYVLDVALACCALEFDAARARRCGGRAATRSPYGRRRLRHGHRPPGPRGDVGGRRRPRPADHSDDGDLVRRLRLLGRPCWDSYAVTKGVDTLLAVDAYVPGCPPPPEALRTVLHELSGRAALGAVG